MKCAKGNRESPLRRMKKGCARKKGNSLGRRENYSPLQERKSGELPRQEEGGLHVLKKLWGGGHGSTGNVRLFQGRRARKRPDPRSQSKEEGAARREYAGK